MSQTGGPGALPLRRPGGPPARLSPPSWLPSLTRSLALAAPALARFKDQPLEDGRGNEVGDTNPHTLLAPLLLFPQS